MPSRDPQRAGRDVPGADGLRTRFQSVRWNRRVVRDGGSGNPPLLTRIPVFPCEILGPSAPPVSYPAANPPENTFGYIILAKSSFSFKDSLEVGVTLTTHAPLVLVQPRVVSGNSQKRGRARRGDAFELVLNKIEKRYFHQH